VCGCWRECFFVENELSLHKMHIRNWQAEVIQRIPEELLDSLVKKHTRGGEGF
jgi:hypothetical protein